MKSKNIISDIITAFFISTTFITIGTGIVGSIYFKDAVIGNEAFFGPPIIGLFTSFISIINYSKKELSMRQAIVRKVIHLFLIEGMILGLNYLSGVKFTPQLYIVIASVIMFIFITVHVLIWLNDKRTAKDFNKELEYFQARNKVL